MTDNTNKIRAFNVIWDFAKNYKLTPKNYDSSDIFYINMLEGEVHNSFDVKIISSFINYITKDNPYEEDIIRLTILFFRNLAYENLKSNSLTIESFRVEFSKKIIKRYTYSSPKNIYEQIENAYYRKALNKPITEGSAITSFYRELFSISGEDTSELVGKLNTIFEKYFNFYKAKNDKSIFEQMIKEKKTYIF